MGDEEIVEALNALVEQAALGFWKCYDGLRLMDHSWITSGFIICPLDEAAAQTRIQHRMLVAQRANARCAMDFMSDHAVSAPLVSHAEHPR